jgi:hypothetical protein
MYPDNMECVLRTTYYVRSIPSSATYLFPSTMLRRYIADFFLLSLQTPVSAIPESWLVQIGRRRTTGAGVGQQITS